MTTDIIKRVTLQKFAVPMKKLVFNIVLSVWFFFCFAVYLSSDLFATTIFFICVYKFDLLVSKQTFND